MTPEEIKAAKACCPHPVERHAYNGCANCGCSMRWTEHPRRDFDTSEAGLLSNKERRDILVAEVGSLRSQVSQLTRERDEARAAVGAELQGLEHEKAEAVRRWQEARAEVERMRPVVEAAIAWSESFGELSKRLPPHVHELRRAVDAYQDSALQQAKGTP